jgi:hypothetical protein
MDRPIPCEVITWNRFYALARRLAQRVLDSGYRPDAIVAIGRGGYMPARILSDFLGIMDLTSFKIEHYTATQKSRRAVVRYPLSADLTGRRVLLVDDVSDSGDTFTTALEHVRGCGTPTQVRTAVLHHKTVSRYDPDYYVHRVVKWRWIIYPWAIAEDLGNLIQAMRPRPGDEKETSLRLQRDHGIRLPRAVLADVLAMRETTGPA